MPRSRSSLLTESLSKYYQIPMIGEDINLVNKMLENRPTWVHDNLFPPKPIGHFNKLKSLLKIVYEHSTGVIRLHPLQFSMAGYSGEVLDFDLFNLQQYDQIYFTDRKTVADSICSHFVSTYVTRKFTYRSAQEIENFVPAASIWLKRYGYIEVCLYEKIIEHEIKKYLVEKNISWVQLDYDSVPTYILENFGEGLSEHVETKYNYKEIISNYDKLENEYNRLQDYVTDRFYKLNTQFKNVGQGPFISTR